MEEFIRYTSRVCPPQTWMENELKINRVIKSFDNYKCSVGYLINDELKVDVHIKYTSSPEEYGGDENKLLKLIGAKAYTRIDASALQDKEKSIFTDIQQTSQKCGISKFDSTVTSSNRMNVAFFYKNFIVNVCAPMDHVVVIAHKILINLVVSPYTHEHYDLEKMIEQYETSHLIDPILCQFCSRPSEKICCRLKLCSGCMSARYCGRGCQKQDWKKHKLECLNKT